MGDAEAAANDLITAAHAYRLELEQGQQQARDAAARREISRDQRHAPNQQMVSPRLGLPRIVNAGDNRNRKLSAQTLSGGGSRPTNRDDGDDAGQQRSPRSTPASARAGRTSADDPRRGNRGNPNRNPVPLTRNPVPSRNGSATTASRRPIGNPRPNARNPRHGHTAKAKPKPDNHANQRSSAATDSASDTPKKGATPSKKKEDEAAASGERRWCQRWGSLHPSV